MITKNQTGAFRPELSDRSFQTGAFSIKLILSAFIILLFFVMEARTQYTCPNVYPPGNNNVGIGTDNPSNKLTVHGISDCPDVTIELSTAQPVYEGFLTLHTPWGPSYSDLSTAGDLVLVSSVLGEDLILSTRKESGKIKFSTTEVNQGPDIERMTITPVGHVGIWNSDPLELLHIGDRLTFHVGALYNFLGYNVYNDYTNDQKRILTGYASRLNFDLNGDVYLATSTSASTGTLVSHNEPSGGFRGIYISPEANYAKIGIGNLPWADNRLLIKGIGSTSATNSLRVVNTSEVTSFVIRDDGNVGIVDDSPSSRLTVKGAGNTDQTSALNIKNSSNTSLFFVRDDGNVGIGVNNPAQKLVVDGIVCAREIRVSEGSGGVCGWPDYVFDDNYHLLSLEEVEEHIKSNKHLPGFPSAEEIENNGLMLLETQKLMMQKIEELTLYIIELKKEINYLKSK